MFKPLTPSTVPWKTRKQLVIGRSDEATLRLLIRSTRLANAVVNREVIGIIKRLMKEK